MDIEGEEAVVVLEMNARARGVSKGNKQVNAVNTLILEAILLAIDNDKSNQIYCCIMTAHEIHVDKRCEVRARATGDRELRSTETQEKRQRFDVLLL